MLLPLLISSVDVISGAVRRQTLKYYHTILFIINLFLLTAMFHFALKSSLISPLQKNSLTKGDLSNYRPSSNSLSLSLSLSLSFSLSILSKITEKNVEICLLRRYSTFHIFHSQNCSFAISDLQSTFSLISSRMSPNYVTLNSSKT